LYLENYKNTYYCG